MLYTFEFFAGVVVTVLMVASVIQTRWATAFWALALMWAMASTRSRLDELALAVLAWGLTFYEIKAGFKADAAQAKMKQAESDGVSRSQ